MRLVLTPLKIAAEFGRKTSKRGKNNSCHELFLPHESLMAINLFISFMHMHLEYVEYNYLDVHHEMC